MAALAEATLELQTIQNLIPGLTAQVDASMSPAAVPPQEPQAASTGKPAEKAAREADETEANQGRESKWFKPDSKGGNPKDKGLGPEPRRSKPDSRAKAASRAAQRTDPAPRKPDHDQPPGFPNSLAVSTYTVAKVWKDTKANALDKLTNPLRVVLFQHVLTTTAPRLEALESSTEQKENAKKLGWLSEDGNHYVRMKWNPTLKKHEVDPGIQRVPVQVAKSMLLEAATLAKEPFAANRFHATRPLSEEYQSPTLTFILEVGLRTQEANRIWQILNNMAQTSVWVAAGVFSRHERLQRTALASRVAQGYSNYSGGSSSVIRDSLLHQCYHAVPALDLPHR